MRYPIFIDLESSGLSLNASYPIQVAFNDEQGNVECHFIRPLDEWTYWDRQAEETHRIRRDTLFEQGKDVRWIASRLNLRLAGKRVYSDAVGYDRQWLDTLFDAASIERKFKLKELQDLAYRMKRYKDFSKISERAWQQVEGQRHRADTDVRHNMKIFEIMNNN